MSVKGTRVLSGGTASAGDFLASYRVALVVVGGGSEGDERELVSTRIAVGRGPDVDWPFADDDAMSRQHAAFEVGSSGVRVVDLGSTNGTQVHGANVESADLKHGDRIEIGEHVFQCLIEPRERAPRAYRV